VLVLVHIGILSICTLCSLAQKFYNHPAEIISFFFV
jgi:hypothetical protein